MKTIILAALLAALSTNEPDIIDSATVSASAVSFTTPVVATTVKSSEIRRQNPQNSLPMSLNYGTSVISTNEGGTGLGYSNIRIRGIGAYQTNVTLNGITLNDAESQEVFWVNIPSLGNILSEVRIQRGLGTSSNGPGSFGASINMVTAYPENRPKVRFEAGYGSYRTFTPSIYFSTGKTKSGFYAQGAYSYSSTDGYMQNAFARVQSIYAATGWAGKNDSFKATFLQGSQTSGITWNGVPIEIYPYDRKYNSSMGDTDNFRQSHIQLNYIHGFGEGWDWNTTLNYTRGDGYYEIDGSRDYLGNNLWVLRSELGWHGKCASASAGIYLSDYYGDHHGEYYSNNADKKEINAFAKAEISLSESVIAYGDIHYRGIRYIMNGPDEYGQKLDFNLNYSFINPRIGFTWLPGDRNKFFTSLSYGNREPSRTDLQYSSSVRPEHLLDWETGYERRGRFYSTSFIFYLMSYKDMLIETGLLDESGYAIKTNVPNAYRRGFEWSGDFHVWKWFRIEHNLSISGNRTGEGNELLLSPSAMGMFGIAFLSPLGTELDIHHKFVGKQYWDNTGNTGHMIPAYNAADLSLTQTIWMHRTRLNLGLYVQNLWNNYYFAYAHAYGVFPQAPRNYMFRLRFEF